MKARVAQIASDGKEACIPLLMRHSERKGEERQSINDGDKNRFLVFGAVVGEGKLRCGTDAADGDDDASMRSITSTQDG